MADDKYRQSSALGQLHERERTFLDLRNAPRRGGILRQIQRLDGVRDQNIGRKLVHSLNHRAEIGLGKNVEILTFDAQPLGAQLELPLGLLAGDVKDFLRLAEERADLQQKGRFADARRAADQHQ